MIKGTPTHFSFINGNKYDNKEVLIIGGEQLSANMCESLLECLGQDCRIINEYGPTEATVGCTYYEYDKTCSNVVPIGKPVYNTEVLVYDEIQKAYLCLLKKQGCILIRDICYTMLLKKR